MTEPEKSPRFHVIIVLRDNLEWLEACLHSLYAQTQPPARVSVYDTRVGVSAPSGFEANFPQVRLLRTLEKIGPGAAANRAAMGIRDAQIVVLLDAEAILALNAMEKLAAGFAAGNSVGVLGCKILNDDVETIHQVGLSLRGNGLPSPLGQGEVDTGQYSGVQEVVCVQRGAVAIRSEVWCELGGLDERYWPAYYEQIDLCLRAQAAGWRVAVACEATVTHFALETAETMKNGAGEGLMVGRARFLIKHYKFADWITKYIPDELRWLSEWSNHGLRMLALRTLFKAGMRGEKLAAGRNG